jgi:drug/metabolite transporter (DMT)-like permease
MMKKTNILGYLFGMLSALCWAISPLFILQALRGLPSPIWGTAIGLCVATLIYLIWYLWQKKWREIPKSMGKAVYWQMFGGLVGGFGILSRNIALETTRVAIVIALAQTASLFTLIFAPFLLGKNLTERITPKLVSGVLFIVVGSILIIVGRNF